MNSVDPMVSHTDGHTAGHIDLQTGNPGVADPKSLLTNKGTLADAMRTLREKGYTANFSLQQDKVVCSEGRCELGPEDFEVEHAFRFDVMSDPGDQSVLYAISAKNHDIKGLLVNGYGIYSEPSTNEILRKLDVPEIGRAHV